MQVYFLNKRLIGLKVNFLFLEFHVGQGGEYPVLHRVFVQHVFIADVVAIAVFTVAIDVDAKDVLDGLFVAVEGGACQLGTSTHFRAYPLLVDVAERDSSCTIDGVDEPDVFFEQGGSSHR